MSNLENALRLNLIEEMSLLPEEFEEYGFSSEYKKNIERLFDKMRGDRIHKFTKKATIIILVAAILFLLAIAGGARIIMKDRQFAYNAGSEAVQYQVVGKPTPKYVDSITVGYIPKGFTKEVVYEDKSSFCWKYKKDDEYFDITKCLINSTVLLDATEGSTQEIQIGEITYLYNKPEDEEYSFVMWNNKEYIIFICSNLPKEEMLKIAQEVY